MLGFKVRQDPSRKGVSCSARPWAAHKGRGGGVGAGVGALRFQDSTLNP